MAKLTAKQIKLLRRIDRAGFFTKDEAEQLPGLHFCGDWDFLPVCDAGPEADGCTCFSTHTALESDNG